MFIQKAKGLFIKVKCQISLSQWEMIASKDQKDQMLWLKVELNVNLQMKRDIELQKPVAHSSIRLGKRINDFILKKMFIHKVKGLFIKVKCQISLSQWEVIASKDQKDQMLWLKMESNVKLQVMLSSFVGGHIYIFL